MKGCMQNSSELHQQKIMPFMWYSKVITRAALDQRKQNRRGSVEKYERTSSKLNTSSRNLN